MRLSLCVKAIFTLLAFGGCVFAQHLDFGLDFGVKGGVPFTDILKATGAITAPVTSLTQTDSYLIGPAAELRLPFGFAIEVDGIYRKAESRLITNAGTFTIDANAWEIPYLAKFRFPIPLLKPFVYAGGAYRTFTSLTTNVTPTHNAVVAGGGLELRISKLRLSGELRWLRWGSSSNVNVVRLGQNQGELLFGLMF